MKDLIEESLYYDFAGSDFENADNTDHYHRESVGESRVNDGISMEEEAFLLGYEELYDDN